jgi:hypothetical protein
MTNKRIGILLGLWNLTLIAVWAGRFHPVPRELAAGVGRNFPSPDGWLGALAVNWGSFIAAAAALLGVMALAGALGRATVIWLGARGEEGLGELAEYGIGLGFLGSIMLGIGLIGLIFPPSHAVSVTVLTVLAISEFRRMRGYFGRIAGSFEREAMSVPVSVVLGSLLLVSLLGIFNIEMGWDSLTYHLRLPSFYIYRHKFYDVWHNYYAFFPSQVEMLFMFSQAALGDMLARFLNAGFGVLLLLAAARTAGALGVPRAWPVLLLASSPLFLLLITRCYVDLGTAFFLAVSVLLLLRWRENGSIPALLASGALAGWGMGSKMFAMVFWVAVAFAAAPKFFRDGGRREFLLWNAALWPVFLPWLARNFLLRGNPAYPFLSALVGLSAVRPGDHVLPFEGLSTAGSTVRSSLPARLEAMIFDDGHIEGPMVPAFGGILPLLAFRPASQAGAFARRLVLAYSVLWLVLFPEIRFLLPVVPAILALAVSGLIRVEPGSGPLWDWSRRVMITGAFLGALFAACLQWRDFQPFSLPFGLETAAGKAKRVLMPPPYTGYLAEYVNQNLPPGDRVLYLCNFVSYYVERECITDFHFGRARITDIIREGRDAEGIARQLRRRGIGWLLLTGSGAAGYRHIHGYFDVPEGSWAEWKRMLKERTEAAWQTNYYVLMRLTGPHDPRPLPVLPVCEALEFASADIALQEGRFAEAAAVYSRPSPLLGDVGSRWSRLGLALSGMGKHAEARKAYEKALALGFRPPRMLLGLATSLFVMKKPDEAMPLAREAWRLDPSSAQAAALLAAIEATRGMYVEAVSWIDKAIRLNPGSDSFRIMRERFVRYALLARKPA